MIRETETHALSGWVVLPVLLVVTVVAVVVPPLGLLFAAGLLWGVALSWIDVVLFVALYVLGFVYEWGEANLPRARFFSSRGRAVIEQRWGEDIPFVNVRCLSDLASSESHLDFRAFLPVASRYASQVAHRLAPVI